MAKSKSRKILESIGVVPVNPITSEEEINLTQEQKYSFYLQRLREYRDTLKRERQELVGISESESLGRAISTQQNLELYDSAIRGLEELFPELSKIIGLKPIDERFEQDVKEGDIVTLVSKKGVRATGTFKGLRRTAKRASFENFPEGFQLDVRTGQLNYCGLYVTHYEILKRA